jgi:hypothetical protein
MIVSEYIYVRFFPGYPVDSLQTGEQFFEFKTHLNFSTEKTVKNVRLIFEVYFQPKDFCYNPVPIFRSFEIILPSSSGSTSMSLSL